MDATELEAGWRRVWRRWIGSLIGPVLGVGLTVGCAGEQRVARVRIANETFGPMTVAVAPALNLSGAADFDPDRFADLMASELSYVEGVTVVPVSRVLAMLTAQGHVTVTSPEHAWELVKQLGSDAILVFAVTEYDPYDPPSIGISAQLYGRRPGTGGGSVDPVALSRQASLASSARKSLAAVYPTSPRNDNPPGALPVTMALRNLSSAMKSRLGWLMP
ncbi:MAG: hypothetical protein IH987_02235 [Planctomycetes bacterium]|nr:hypothetical protein [Planctomycetota bacterium]